MDQAQDPAQTLNISPSSAGNTTATITRTAGQHLASHGDQRQTQNRLAIAQLRKTHCRQAPQTTRRSGLNRRAARAVGTAVGRNPISFVVPCHRVLGRTGGLCGYHWGLTRKRAILGWEAGLTGPVLQMS